MTGTHKPTTAIGTFRGAFAGPLIVNLISAILQPMAWPIIFVAASISCYWLCTKRTVRQSAQQSDQGGAMGSGTEQASAPLLAGKPRRAVFLTGTGFLIASLVTGVLACQRGESMGQPAFDWIAARFDRLDAGQEQIQTSQQEQLEAVSGLETRIKEIAETLLKQVGPEGRMDSVTDPEGPRRDLQMALTRYAQASEESGKDPAELLSQVLEGKTGDLMDFLDGEIESGTDDLHTLYTERFLVAYVMGNNNKALESVRVAAALRPDRARDQTLYGYLLMQAGDYPVALHVLQDALSLYRKNDGNSPNIPQVLLNIGLIQVLLNQHDQALDTFRDAETTARKTLGEDDEIVSDALFHTGRLLNLKEEYHDAMKSLRQAEQILRDKHGEKSARLAETLESIGSIYEALKDYAAAIEVYEQAEAAYRQVYGDEHEEVADAVADIAYILEAMDKPAASLERYREAEQIYRSVFGGTHVRVANTLHDIGFVLDLMDDSEGALDAYREAEKIWTKTLPPGHEDIASVRQKINKLEAQIGER